MKAGNDARGYGWVARVFHWSIAFLIIAAIALGLYADNLRDTAQDQIQKIFEAFSLHKTVGIAVLFIGLARILWMLTQKKPRHLHPDRKLETFTAEVMHVGLYLGMIILPLSGWLVHSAAPGGFARILWPFGQRLPGVPENLALSEKLATFHALGWWMQAAMIALHLLGVVKHSVIDRDATLARMAGPAATLPEPPAAPAHREIAAPVVALALWAGLAGYAAFIAPAHSDAAAASAETPAVQSETAPAATATTAAPATPDAASTAPASATGWAVESGTLGISVTQSGSAVAGSFANWQAAIDFDPATGNGHVRVTVDIASLTLGAVSDTAKGPDFLNASQFPEAVFEGDIAPAPAGGSAHIAKGDLTIAGQSVPSELAFDLVIEGDQASAKGGLTVDRREFGIGKNYADEGTVSFPVAIEFDLTATRR